jgi:Lrp/AsnC family transcriptional regulator for asnA, asnC and gidA
MLEDRSVGGQDRQGRSGSSERTGRGRSARSTSRSVVEVPRQGEEMTEQRGTEARRRDSAVASASVAGGRSGVGSLDEINKAIIEQLQADGRRSYGAIAQAVGLSEAAVRQRVQRLRESGMIQIVAVTDPLQVGFNRQGMVGICVEGDVRRVAEKLASVPEIDYVVICAGAYDLLVELVCEDDNHLLEVLTSTIRAIPGVRSTETFQYLKLVKQTYTWGVR